jgi:hypothetical protein
VLIDFGVKSLAESYSVHAAACWDGRAISPFSEPEMELIKKMKASPVHERGTHWLIVSSEKDGRSKYSLESLHHTPVIAAIFREAKKVEHLGSAVEMDDAALLPKGESGYPDGNEAVLSEGQSIIWMCNDVKEEVSVATFVQHLVLREGAEGKPAQHERPSVEGEFLLVLLPLFPNQQDGI